MDLGKRFRGEQQQPDEGNPQVQQQPTEQPMVPQNNLPDILGILRIDPHIPIPDDLLTNKELSHVQFRVSEPEGYLHSDVEDFHATVKQTISWFETTLHERDADIARLASEYDRMQTDLQNVKYEREFTEINAADKVPLADYNAALTKIAELEAGGSGVVAGGLTDEEREAYNALQAWADQVEPAYNALQEELDALKAGGATPDEGSTMPIIGEGMSDEDKQTLIELQAWADQVEPAYAALEAERDRLQEALTQAQASNDNPTPGTDGPLTDVERQAWVELQAWAEQVEPAYAALEEELAQAKMRITEYEAGGAIAANDGDANVLLEAAHQALAEAEKQTEEYREYAKSLDEYLDQVTPIIEAYTQELEAGETTPLAASETSDDDQHGQPEANLTDDSNLPAIVTPFTGQERPSTPTVARTDETPEERFNRILSEMQDDSDAPELGSGIRFESAEKKEDDIKPGAPLTSLLPGEKIEDFL